MRACARACVSVGFPPIVEHYYERRNWFRFGNTVDAALYACARLCSPSQLALPPGFQVIHMPNGNLNLACTIYRYVPNALIPQRACQLFYGGRGVFLHGSSHEACRKPACKLRRKFGSRPSSAVHALGVLSRTTWLYFNFKGLGSISPSRTAQGDGNPHNFLRKQREAALQDLAFVEVTVYVRG